MTPGEAELAVQELGRAERALEEARTLRSVSSLEGATSRLYYAVFHAARATLVVRGGHAKTHSGQITLFGELHGPAPILSRLLELRSQADYGREGFELSQERFEELEGEAAEFLGRCREIVEGREERGPDEPDPPPDL